MRAPEEPLRAPVDMPPPVDVSESGFHNRSLRRVEINDAEAIAVIIEKFEHLGHTPISAAAWAEKGAEDGREQRSYRKVDAAAKAKGAAEATDKHDPRAAEDKS